MTRPVERGPGSTPITKVGQSLFSRSPVTCEEAMAQAQLSDAFADPKYLFVKPDKTKWNGQVAFVDQLDGTLCLERYYRHTKEGGCFSSQENLAIAYGRKFDVGTYNPDHVELFTPPSKAPSEGAEAPKKAKADPVFVYEHFPDGSVVPVKGSNLNRELTKSVHALEEEEVDNNTLLIWNDPDGATYLVLAHEGNKKRPLGARKVPFVKAVAVRKTKIEVPEPAAVEGMPEKAPKAPKVKKEKVEGAPAKTPSPPKKRKASEDAPKAEKAPKAPKAKRQKRQSASESSEPRSSNESA